MPGNDLDADRINLVFAPWGWDDLSSFVTFVTGSLSWTGDAYLYDADGQITNDPTQAIDAALGLFAIEPWRSSLLRDSASATLTTGKSGAEEGNS